MKKLICAAAALGLVAGVATTASALDFSVTGMYQAEGYYLDTADGAGFNPYDDEHSSDSYWVHTFIMKPTLKVNDKITMKADVRALKDTDWGSTGGTTSSQGIAGDRDLDIHKIYMEYMSPIGKFRVGRTAAAAWQGAYLNNPTNADRIYFFPKMDKPWGSYVFMQKANENDRADSDNDSDRDIYEACVYYTAKDTKWAVGYNLYNDKRASDTGVPTTSYDAQYHRVKGYVKQNIADLWVEAEIAYEFGDWMDYDVETIGDTEDVDVDTLSFMAAVGTSFDNLKVSALYFYAQGDDDLTDYDKEDALGGPASDGTGDGFNPYYILTGDHTGMLNSDETGDDVNMATAGVHCIGVSADLAVSDKLTLHGAFAYAWAADEDGVSDAAVLLGGTSIDDEYGWEVDLGAKYKLLDNLTYEVRAAYMDTGDFFADIVENNNLLTGSNDDEADLMLLSHHLTMTF